MNIIKNPDTKKTPETQKGSGMTVTFTEFTIKFMRPRWSPEDGRVNKMLNSQVHNLVEHLEDTLQNASAGSLAFLEGNIRSVRPGYSAWLRALGDLPISAVVACR